MRGDGTIVWVDGPGEHMIDGMKLRALSCTFIPARLSDNRFLHDGDVRGAADEPAGADALEAAGRRFPRRPRGRRQPGEPVGVDRGRAGPLDAGRRARVPMTTLGVDVAQGGAADTVLAPLHGTWFGPLTKRRGVDTTNGPAVAALVVEVIRDGAQVNIDLTGGWGGSARDHLVAQGIRVEPVVFSGASSGRSRDGLLTFLNKRTRDVVEIPRGALPGDGRGHRAAAGQAARRAARGADLEAARQHDRDREQGGIWRSGSGARPTMRMR